MNSKDEEFLGTGPGGLHLCNLIDPTALFGDYPASSETSDSMSHYSDAFCTQCGFSKRKELDNRRLAFIRLDQRMTKLWKSSPHSEVPRMLVMNFISQEEASHLPRVSIRKILQE